MIPRMIPARYNPSKAAPIRPIKKAVSANAVPRLRFFSLRSRSLPKEFNTLSLISTSSLNASSSIWCLRLRSSTARLCSSAARNWRSFLAISSLNASISSSGGVVASTHSRSFDSCIAIQESSSFCCNLGFHILGNAWDSRSLFIFGIPSREISPKAELQGEYGQPYDDEDYY